MHLITGHPNYGGTSGNSIAHDSGNGHGDGFKTGFGGYAGGSGNGDGGGAGGYGGYTGAGFGGFGDDGDGSSRPCT